MRTTIVIPTYNEKDNIISILDSITQQNISDLSVLIVDDSSPDGTGELVKEFSKIHPQVSLLTRAKKEGLGRAYIAGFKESVNRGAEAIIQMDADFSHDPNDIPRLLDKLKDKDLVIGSRYMQGGRVSSDWPLRRRLLSQWANVYARLVTGVPVTDLTGGFKAWKADLLKKMDLDSVRADGYGFQIEMNSRAFFKGARIVETPIVFIDRKNGQSKISRDIVWEALFLVWKIRFTKK